ncbi:MAG: FMN-binding negative transcriptional regulator [Flavipsychrobacter sp.]|nr:FMN-binding negative transcriptional regulator [Flavipsychrobacter sp.]
MYKIPQFTEPDASVVETFMEEHPFVTLIGCHNNTSVATQVPVLLHKADGKMVVTCHIMRHTDHYAAIEHNPDVLLLFQGSNCYVSPSWYTEKMGGTWNYQTVHVRGKCRIMSNEETMELLARLTARFEAEQQNPLLTSDLPKDYMPSLVGAIAGLEIEATSIYPIFKLSQNRDDESYKNIVHHLQSSADTEAHKISTEMRKRRPNLFD